MNEGDVGKVIDYVDGRHLKNRQIRAKRTLVNEKNNQTQSEQGPLSYGANVEDAVAYAI